MVSKLHEITALMYGHEIPGKISPLIAELEGHLTRSHPFKGTLGEEDALSITEAFTAFAMKYVEMLNAVLKKAPILPPRKPVRDLLLRLDELLGRFTASLLSPLPSTHADTINKQAQSIKDAAIEVFESRYLLHRFKFR